MNIINNPTIHAHGRDPVRRGVSAQMQPIFHSVKYPSNVPPESVLCSNRAIRETMHHLNLWLALLPSQKRHTATLCAQIYRNQSRSFLRRLHRSGSRSAPPRGDTYPTSEKLP